jgi:hypothetical protein
MRLKLLKWSLFVLAFWIFIFQPLYYLWEKTPVFTDNKIRVFLGFLFGFFSEGLTDKWSLLKEHPENFLQALNTIGIGIVILILINKVVFKRG